MSKNQITTIVWAAALLWALLAIINGVAFSQTLFSLVSTVIGILVIGVAIFDRWLWKLSFLHPLAISAPVLEGTWKGELKSNYIDQKTGNVVPAIEAYLFVKQTYSTITLRLMTKESSSESISTILMQRGDDGPFSLAGIYCNTPSPEVSERSPMHKGSVSFDVIDENAPLLDGEYWTNRLTKGSIRFDQRIKKGIRDYRTAVDAFVKLSEKRG